jgi:hypothetical protein
MIVINFCFLEYLAILERLRVEGKGSLGYYRGALRLWTGPWNEECKYGVVKQSIERRTN